MPAAEWHGRVACPRARRRAAHAGHRLSHRLLAEKPAGRKPQRAAGKADEAKVWGESQIVRVERQPVQARAVRGERAARDTRRAARRASRRGAASVRNQRACAYLALCPQAPDARRCGETGGAALNRYLMHLENDVVSDPRGYGPKMTIDPLGATAPDVAQIHSGSREQDMTGRRGGRSSGSA